MKCLPACLRLYSRRSLVLSGPRILPHPRSGTIIAVELSSPPSSSVKVNIRLAAALGLGAPLARSTISSSERIDDIPSETKTINAHSLPAMILFSKGQKLNNGRVFLTFEQLRPDFRLWRYSESLVAEVTQTCQMMSNLVFCVKWHPHHRVLARAPIHLVNVSIYSARSIKPTCLDSPYESVIREDPIILRNRMLSTCESAW